MRTPRSDPWKLYQLMYEKRKSEWSALARSKRGGGDAVLSKKTGKNEKLWKLRQELIKRRKKKALLEEQLEVERKYAEKIEEEEEMQG